MDLITVANEYEMGVKSMSEELKKLFGEMVLEEDFDPEHLGLIQKLFGMVEMSNRLVVEQAKTIQEINNKLDKLLEN